MKNRYLFLLNVLIALCTAVILFSKLPTPTGKAQYPKIQPGAAAPMARPPTHLVFVNYPANVTNGPALSLAEQTTGLRDFVGYGQPLWLPHTGQAQGQPVHMVSTP
ncbi:MAG: hypothetical protein KA314_00710 [Chloroflexi bacterium]|nr:hypothetical protein [Chloroflexota bacterium]MBP8054327.1 hypothetical protein [Chloroflexota bacterium]